MDNANFVCMRSFIFSLKEALENLRDKLQVTCTPPVRRPPTRVVSLIAFGAIQPPTQSSA